MKIGDLVRTTPSTAPWEKTYGIIEERDPNSLQGPGWWILLPSHGYKVSRHPGDIEVINESR